jgi:DNA (cytosine-5)-methyltransferase 1
VLAGVDKDPFAVETHAAHFPGLSTADDIASEDTLDDILEPLRGRRIDLLAGGPPCQPFSKISRWIRSVAFEGIGSLRDHRRELWRSFLYAAEVLRPNAILIENVTDIATNEDGVILRAIFSKLEELEYSFDCRSYFAYDLGVPQHRLRIFIIGFKRSTGPFGWPEPVDKRQRATLRDAISDLPPLDGGWDEPTPPYGGPITPLQKMLRGGLVATDNCLFDHVTRAVRKDDLIAFGHLTARTKYYELPEELRRYGAVNFVDKYNRLSWDEPCRGITAHLGKDGYWYIHPDQHRSLSIREAARVQSFPDWFRFAGFRTSAFRQIGEAVAPLVAEALGRKIIEHLGSQHSGRGARRRNKNSLLRELLESWYDREAKSNALHPWRLEQSLWINLMGETLFADRAQRAKASRFWKNYARDWSTAKYFLKDKHRESHLRTIGLSEKLPVLEALANYLCATRSPTLKELLATGVSERHARRALTISGRSHERPNDPALVRVASRVFERTDRRDSSAVESQVATAMLVGEDEGAVLYAAAIELGESICSSSNPACLLCPISKLCAHHFNSEELQ